MENTVTLTLKEFDDLRKFKETIEKNDVVKVYHRNIYGRYFDEYTYFYITANDAIKEIANTNKALDKIIIGLAEQIVELEKQLEIKNQNEAVKTMSIWQFLKWREE